MKRIFLFFKKTFSLLNDKSYSTLAGAIAFFLIINGGSLLYLLYLVSYYLDISVSIDLEIIKNIANEVSEVSSKTHILIFLFSSLYGSSTLFYHLLKTGEIIYHVKVQRFRFIKRIIAFIFMLICVFTIEVFILVLSFSKSIFSNKTIIFLNPYFIFLLLYLIIVLINYFITPNKVLYTNIRRGAIFSTIFSFIITILFNLYLKVFANYKRIYGALTVFIIFMIWLYLLSQGLVIGFIINYYESKRIDEISLEKI